MTKMSAVVLTALLTVSSAGADPGANARAAIALACACQPAPPAKVVVPISVPQTPAPVVWQAPVHSPVYQPANAPVPVLTQPAVYQPAPVYAQIQPVYRQAPARYLVLPTLGGGGGCANGSCGAPQRR